MPERPVPERLAVRGGHVLTMDPDLGDLPDGEVVVEDGTIVAVGPARSGEPAAPDTIGTDTIGTDTIDATGCVVLPGFVDGHRHMWQTFLRGVVPNCTLDTYMRDVLFGLAPHVGPDEGHVGTLLGALECLNAGITTVVDWSHALTGPADADARVAALLESGIRGYFAPNTPAAGEWYSWDAPRTHPADIRRLREQYFAGNDGRLRLAAALRSPGQVPDGVVTADWAMARDLGLMITIHAGARHAGGESHDVEALHRLGLLGPDLHLAHGNVLHPAELDLLARTGGHVTASPYAELTAGHGPLQLARMWQHGVRPGLSADATAMAPGDMFSEMRVAFAAARLEQLPPDPADAYAPTVTVRDVLTMATAAGAESIGLGDVCGSLTPGKAADLVLVRADAVGTAPLIDPVATVVTSADTANVDTVVVDGRVVKRHGALVGVDVPDLVRRAERARDRVLAHRSGSAGPVA